MHTQFVELKHQISQKPKLKHYYRFNQNLMDNTEPYLKIANKKSRSIFARLRLGSLKLLIAGCQPKTFKTFILMEKPLKPLFFSE